MKPLTLTYATKNNFRLIDCVKYFKPDWSDKECDVFIWEHTCYPFSTSHQLIKELNNKFLKKK
jgi:hypothetical protein